jgi:hypothetical protein
MIISEDLLKGDFMALACKYCGISVKEYSGGGLVGSPGSSNCSSSPTRKHVAVSHPPYCVFCGRETKPYSGGGLTASGVGVNCSASPTHKHQLDD